ncbi:hypothetical protein GTY88_14195, partial [Streptomyces sp. SID5926]|nr:hypothetical protein [Streptomyces sp. SID5926]
GSRRLAVGSDVGADGAFSPPPPLPVPDPGGCVPRPPLRPGRPRPQTPDGLTVIRTGQSSEPSSGRSCSGRWRSQDCSAALVRASSRQV